MSSDIGQNGNQNPHNKRLQIEWRRGRVLELSSQGRTEREIAGILQVGKTTVDRDLAFLGKQSQENLKTHLSQIIPAQYQKCMNGITQVLKMAWNIVILDSVNHASKLQALSLINDCYKYQMDLTTNAGILADAMKFVTHEQEEIDTLHKLDERIETMEEETTTNGVF
jgi:hypothetical protein